MSLTTTVFANSTDLTTLARVKQELGISGSTQDDQLNDLIDEATSFFQEECDRKLARQRYDETAGARDRQFVLITREAPLVTIEEITRNDDTIDADEYIIADTDAGRIFNEFGWTSDTILLNDLTVFPSRHQEFDITIDYWAGYLLPGDDVSETTISAQSSDNSFNDSANNFPATLVAGDRITVSGFANSGANGTFTVAQTSTASKIVVEESVTDDTNSGGNPIDVVVRNLPRDVERGVLDIVRQMYFAACRDPALGSQDVAGIRNSWPADKSGLTPIAQRIVNRWRRWSARMV